MYKVLAVLILSLVLTACSSDTVLTRGEQATVTRDTLVAIDVDTLEELQGMSDNEIGIASMIAEGVVGTIDEGEEVTVIDPVAGYHMVQIRTLSGEEVIIDEDSLEQ